MHKLVQLVIGVPRARGDDASDQSEGPLGFKVIDLTNQKGFALDPNGGWIPQMTAIKNNGVYADSILNVGRILIGGDDDNVTETMKLTLSGGREYVHLIALNRFIRQAREFWTADYQLEPTYIKWHAEGATYPQYARMFDITLSISPPSGEAISPMDITLTIEREPYWDAEPPGENPKVYYFRKNDTQWDDDDLSLWEGTNHFAVGTVQNRHEWATGSDENTPLTQNYIDIPAADIPGDAPALVCINLEMGSGAIADAGTIVKMARYSRPLTTLRRSNPGSTTQSERNKLNLLNATDASLPAGSARANDSSFGVQNNSTGTQQRVDVSSFSTSSYGESMAWGPDEQFDMTRFQGQWAIYCRCKQNGGSAGDITLNASLSRSATGGYDVITNQSPSPVIDEYSTLYLGTLNIPPQARIAISADGIGIGTYLRANGHLQLRTQRPSGAATLSVIDVLLMPVDEPFVEIVSILVGNSIISAAGNRVRLLYDNTGYLDHGRSTDDVALSINEQTSGITYSDISTFTEVRGKSITLRPGVDNRLYFYVQMHRETTDDDDDPNVPDMTVRVNIMPRWIGPRDD